MKTTENAYAKLNISLDVTGKRPDGYHDMLMVMQTVSLCDEISLELKEGSISRAYCNLPYVPSDGRNLAVKAAAAFFEANGIENMCAEIQIKKLIPVGAGMAGGSTDAAAVLRALNRLTGKPMSRDGLESLASKIGSDVAFCVSGGTRLASGRGEILSSLSPLPNCFFAICKPEFSIQTPELFKLLDSCRLRCHPDTGGICEALSQGELRAVAQRMYNVFEDVPDRRHKTIADIKHRLIDSDALGAVMTGTGSAVFGIFDDEAKRDNALEKLRSDYRFCYAAENIPELSV